MSISLPNVELRQVLLGLKSNLRSPKEFFKKSKFELPSTYDGSIKRIVANINHFYSNYLLAIAVFIVVAM